MNLHKMFALVKMWPKFEKFNQHLQSHAAPGCFPSCLLMMHKLIKHIKCSGQRQHPHSYFGNFTRMLNIGTNFLHPQSKNTRISQILLGLSVCMWQTEDGNRNGARGSKTDVCVCVCEGSCEGISHSQNVYLFLVSVTNWGPRLCDRGN